MQQCKKQMMQKGKGEYNNGREKEELKRVRVRKQTFVGWLSHPQSKRG